MVGIKGKTILVTGGAGFIGSHLADNLADKGAVVIVVDISINPSSFFVQNKVYTKTTFELLDIRDQGAVDALFGKYTFDYVFHLAAEAIVEKAYDNPYPAFETNIMGTVHILEAARKYKTKGVLVTSTDKAYGKTKEAYTEQSPLKGDHPYDVSKSAADLIAQTYFKTYNLPVVVTRFGNVYGEGDVHLNRIIPGICEAVIKDKILEIRSDGKYVRDYLYVQDVVDGCLLLLSNFEKIVGECFNFSSSETYPVLSLVKKAEKILNKKISVKILNTAKNEIPYQHLNDQKIRSLGYKNNYTIESTLPELIEWYKKIV